MRSGTPFGAKVVHVTATGSTNDDLKGLAVAGAPEGTVVRADRQDSGRGRAGRAWSSPEGGLWFSLLLRPESPAVGWGLIPLVVGAGVAAVLRARGVPATLKWPNDVLVEGRKVAGVLCEARAGPGGFVVAGVGVNANVDAAALPPELRGVAESLLHRGGPHDLSRLMRDVLAAIESRYRATEGGAVEELLGEYRSYSATIGRRVRLADGRVGVAVDVLGTGSLLVESEDGSTHPVAADDVHVTGVT